MKTRNLFRLLSVFAVLAVFLVFEAQTVAASPQAPIPIGPLEGSTIVTPTFSWEASAGAAKYEVEVGPQSDPTTVYWTAQTVHLTLTPNDAHDFVNAPLYWRVRAKDSADVAGLWSSKINFTKTIPAPTLVSPANGSANVIIPAFQWQVVPEATYYQVELSTVPSFVPVEATYTTYNTHMTPVNTLAHGIHYWRVSGMDADGHEGTPSTARSFTKIIPAPTLISPADGSTTVVIPTFQWQAVGGAAYYKVELSTSPTFLPVDATYTTYNLQITRVATLALNTYYWRVSGVDADGHVGGNGSRSFTLIAPPAATDTTPTLNTPANAGTIATDPTFSWTRVVGAHDYRLVVSTNASFSPTYDSVLTHYNSYTPNTPSSPDAYPNDTYYWKVEARNGSAKVIATSGGRSFTKQESLPLTAPADGVTGLTVDPTFQWSQIVGAHHYRLVVSTDPSFSPNYDTVNTDYNSYTPYAPSSPDAYPNGTYYWKVEARTDLEAVIATSSARSLTKQESLPLVAPANGAALASTPTFQWSQIVGAHHYRLVVSTSPSFSPTYNSLFTDYNTYTPYSPAGLASYANGTYYWKVEARTDLETVITTSTAWTFTIRVIKLYLPLVLR